MHRKEYTIMLTVEDALDVKLSISKNQVTLFSLNYRTLIKGKWREVFRADTAHGYLHCQKYWISTESMPLRQYEHMQLKAVFNALLDMLKEDWEKYKALMADKIRQEGEKNAGH